VTREQLAAELARLNAWQSANVTAAEVDDEDEREGKAR
jgi:hypothetical protein